MKKIEQITKQDLKENNRSFEQVQDLLKDAQCELVPSKPLQNIEAYRKSGEFYSRTDSGPDSAWTIIEGPNGAFLVAAISRTEVMERIQGKHQTEQQRDRQTA